MPLTSSRRCGRSVPQIMRQIPVKDVRFKLAFQNGKAAIRYMTVT